MRLKYLALAFALVAALALAACGNDDSSSTSATSPNGADRAFASAMIPHHQAAVQMAEIAGMRGESTFVRKLAADVTRTQNAEIEILRERIDALKAQGIEEGSLGVPEHMMGMENDIGMLRVTGSFDDAFIRMMIPHHEGAITMARAELEKGGDATLKELAQDIIDAQQREIDEMNAQLGESDEPAEESGGGHDEHTG